MILLWIIIIFSAGAFVAWVSERWGKQWPRRISMAILLGHMGLLIYLWVQYGGEIPTQGLGPWFIFFRRSWIPQLGIQLFLGMDGIALLLITLSNFLGIMAVAASWNAIQERVGFFHFNLLWLVAALAAIFLALDLFLFYLAWELMLIPLYFLIAIWGYERRIYAAVKFFIFTRAIGLAMLLGILGLYIVHHQNTGVYTFSYTELLGTTLSKPVAWLLMLAFFFAFAVKLPVVPLHSWLPDAHTQAPTAGSVDLAGLVLKVGGYGLLRFAVPLFPDVALEFTPVAMALGVVSILYGAHLAFGQTDFKRLVAYSSVSHMGFVLLGIYAWNDLALQGALMVMLAHGISTGALFIVVGDLYERTHNRDLGRLGGLWARMPGMGGVTMVLVMASVGLPGLGNFVGEFLVLLGAYQVNVPLTVLAALGFIVSVVYSLRIIQQVFHGPVQAADTEGWKLHDLTLREGTIMAVMLATLLWLGLYPQTALSAFRPAVDALQEFAVRGRVTEQLAPAPSQVLELPASAGSGQVSGPEGGQK